MKSCRILAAALLLGLAACTPKARINCTVRDYPYGKLTVRQQRGAVVELVDSVRTDAFGAFKYAIAVRKGQPEFLYIYKDNVKLASLLLEAGEKVVIDADTLGNYASAGSEGTALMRQVDSSYSAYMGELLARADDTPEAIGRVYVEHYRASVRFVLTHSRSLAVIPVLYEGVDGVWPTFCQKTDAMIFRSVCDSLRKAWPESRYVAALEKETRAREHELEMDTRIASARELPYPPMSMPGIDGRKVALDSLVAKAVLIHFWTSADAEQKMFNLDVLKPLYAKYHPCGLEIYAVCVDADKARWATAVKAQELPWVNVNDGLGTASRSLALYNVGSLPSSFLISGSGISTIRGEAGLRRELDRLLK